MNGRGWMMEDGRSLPIREFIFLVHFSKLTNCYISRKQVLYMAAGDASQIIPVQIMHVFMLCCSTEIEHVQF